MIRARFAIGAILTCALLAGCGKYEERSYEIGYQGEARINPFLAASRLIGRFGHTADRSSGISRLPGSETTIILPADSVPSFGSAKRLRHWVEGGGHLIYLVSGYSRRDPVSPSAIWDALDEQEHPLLDEFGIEIVAADDENLETELRIHSQDLTVDLPGDDAVDVPASLGEPDVASGSAENSRLLSLPIAKGRLTVISNATPFRNRNIENHDHARVFLELVDLHSARDVLFIYGKGTTFMKMLFHYAWMPLLGLAALTTLWIWKNLPRFGPVVPMLDGSSRQFTEHIETSGRFLWRHKASAALLAPLTTHIQRTFQKKYPHVGGSAEAQIDYFTEHTELPREEISEALAGLPARDPASMTRIVRNLKLLVESL